MTTTHGSWRQTSIPTRRRINRDLCETFHTCETQNDAGCWRNVRTAHFLQQQDGNTLFGELAQTVACSAQAIVHVRLDTHHEICIWLCMVMISSLLEMATTSIGYRRNEMRSSSWCRKPVWDLVPTMRQRYWTAVWCTAILDLHGSWPTSCRVGCGRAWSSGGAITDEPR